MSEARRKFIPLFYFEPESSAWLLCLPSAGSFLNPEDMHNRIKELRARHGLTQDDLARQVGVRRETIVFLEKGKYNPSLKLAYDIARSFNERIEEVFIFE